MKDLQPTLDQLSALSHELRLKAFRALMEVGPDGMQAGAISEHLGIAPNHVSHHLSILTQSGLISVEKHGRRMIYRANIDCVNGLISALIENCCHGHPDVCGPLADLQSVKC